MRQHRHPRSASTCGHSHQRIRPATVGLQNLQVLYIHVYYLTSKGVSVLEQVGNFLIFLFQEILIHSIRGQCSLTACRELVHQEKGSELWTLPDPLRPSQATVFHPGTSSLLQRCPRAPRDSSNILEPDQSSLQKGQCLGAASKHPGDRPVISSKRTVSWGSFKTEWGVPTFPLGMVMQVDCILTLQTRRVLC